MAETLMEIASLNGKVKTCQLDLEEVVGHLQQFEHSYKMSSDDFFRNYSSGKLRHGTDFVEWYAYLDMSKLLLSKIRDLERELGDVIEQKLFTTA